MGCSRSCGCWFGAISSLVPSRSGHAHIPTDVCASECGEWSVRAKSRSRLGHDPSRMTAGDRSVPSGQPYDPDVKMRIGLPSALAAAADHGDPAVHESVRHLLVLLAGGTQHGTVCATDKSLLGTEHPCGSGRGPDPLARPETHTTQSRARTRTEPVHR